MTGEFEYTIERHYQLGLGIYRLTARNDPDFPDGAFWDLRNCVYEQESDNPETMRGTTRIGTTDMGGTVSGFLDYNNGDKLVAMATDGKVYQYTSGDWVVESGARATGNSTTATTRWSSAMFYGATTTANLGVLCNGIDAPAKYNGTDVTDLGGSPPSTGNFPVPWQGRLWMAAGSVLHYSATNDCEEWSTGAGNIVINRGNDGNITGLAPFGNNLFIFKRSSCYRIAPTGTLTELSIVRNVSNEFGCTCHNSIHEAGPEGGTYLTFLSERGLMAIVASSASTGFRIVPVDRWVRPIIKNRNKDADNVAFAVWNSDRREYWFHYASGSATSPNAGLIGNYARENKPPRWTRTDLPSITAGVMFNEGNTDYVHYIGDSAGRVHQMHVEAQSTFDGIPITGQMITPFAVQGRPETMKEYFKSFVDVTVDGSYTVTVRQQMLRTGLPTAGSNTTGETFTDSDSNWGVGEWGVALWGGSGSAGRWIMPPTVSRATGLGHSIEVARWFRLNGFAIASDLRNELVEA